VVECGNCGEEFSEIGEGNECPHCGQGYIFDPTEQDEEIIQEEDVDNEPDEPNESGEPEEESEVEQENLLWSGENA
jgi:DNA-directed RNA polymerase subunit RPC12/RpoP